MTNVGCPPVASPEQASEDQLADVYAWGGIYVSDGRVISLAWLYGWPGAVASPPRQVRRAS